MAGKNRVFAPSCHLDECVHMESDDQLDICYPVTINNGARSGTNKSVGRADPGAMTLYSEAGS